MGDKKITAGELGAIQGLFGNDETNNTSSSDTVKILVKKQSDRFDSLKNSINAIEKKLEDINNNKKPLRMKVHNDKLYVKSIRGNQWYVIEGKLKKTEAPFGGMTSEQIKEENEATRIGDGLLKTLTGKK